MHQQGSPIAVSKFTDLNLSPELSRAIDKLGFSECTPIQAQTLPHSLDGEDIIGQAQTGTGKTAAFLITIIAYHLENPETEPRPDGTPYALIIAPTRELVLQITEDCRDLTRFTDLKFLALVGGIDYDKQRRACRGAVDIVIATPGRLLDFCRSSVVHLEAVEILVLDEADRMLDMGFIPDVRSIIRRTPAKVNRQTMLFSATVSDDIRRLSEQWTQNPVQLAIEPQQIAVNTVSQVVYLMAKEQKYTVLRNLLVSEGVEKALVFANRRDQTRDLEQKLRRDGIDCALLAGDVPQRKRMQTLDAFKSGRIRVLVATDVAGRGLHVEDISHVINYTLPDDPEDYVHRIGRTGRAGATGQSISFACEMDAFQIPVIEALLGNKLECVQPAPALLKPIR